jgi:hypothetical protein
MPLDVQHAPFASNLPPLKLPPPPIKPMVLLQTSEQRARSDGATPNHLPLSRAW